MSQALAAAPSRSPPDRRLGPIPWIVANLFSPWWNALLTAFTLWVSFLALAGLYGWAVRDAAFGTTPETCQGIEGACWSFIADTFELFLVGIYPADQRWRPFVCFGILFVLAVVSRLGRGRQRLWPIYALWGAAPVAILVLLLGGDWVGLPVVPTSRWGGLLLTLILGINGIVFAFPLGVLLALGRRSRSLPAVKLLCVVFIEVIRGVPLISILFMASVLVPLFMPSGVEIDAMVRAQVGIIIFEAGYLAEVVRSGLQGVPRGQEEAAKSLGLKYGPMMFKVIVPQALRIVLPALTNQFIITLKDSSLVAVVGLFDLLGIAEVAMRSPKWLGTTFEAFALVGFFYWLMCFSLSRASLKMEERLKASQR